MLKDNYRSPEDFLEQFNALLAKYERRYIAKAAIPFDYITTSEALQLLQINSSKTLLRLYRKGIIGRSVLEGKFYYRRSEILKALEHNYKSVNSKTK